MTSINIFQEGVDASRFRGMAGLARMEKSMSRYIRSMTQVYGLITIANGAAMTLDGIGRRLKR